MTARLPLTPPTEGRLRLIGGVLIDGTGSAPIVDAEIEIDGDRIVWAGPRRGDGDADPDVVTVDLQGATVLPGFFDTHVHLALSLEADPRVVMAEFPSERVLGAATTIRQTLMAGITTARDLAGLDAGYRSAIAAGTILGPRLHLALQALSPTGGHTDFHLPNGTPVQPAAGPEISPIIDSDDDVRRTVRQLVRAEADVIKVCTTGGVSSPSDTPHDLGVPERHVRMIVEETARRQGQPVAAHAQGAEGIKEAIRGGVASIEHGYEIDDEGIDLMLERGTTLVPTLSSALRVPDPARVPGYLYEKKVRWSKIAREHVAKAIQAGVPVALGTDSGVCPHGRNLTELGHMVDLGLSPMAAIQAGTINAARLLRLEEHLGTIEAGKLADLVITDIDPLADIHGLADPVAIDAIVQGGRVVKDTQGRFPSLPAVTALG
ncbi:amidohydrolase family protein [Microbacterium sp. W1N]|uniref:metal-dependent hydrolase family protein n=1 Tax=Microbacterium festucae TaxID=2977531 RepID=UPI0021C09DD1|nr:amidohydrolase family protein [Microbacterium festucae]MCT9820840.1 amidohydrolase family protein [Microbacterium festucae]